MMEFAETLTNRRALRCLVSRFACVCVCVLFFRGVDGAKHVIERKACVASKPPRIPGLYRVHACVLQKVLDKRSAIVVGPTANFLNAVAAEADRSCPAPAPTAAVAS